MQFFLNDYTELRLSACVHLRLADSIRQLNSHFEQPNMVIMVCIRLWHKFLTAENFDKLGLHNYDE